MRKNAPDPSSADYLLTCYRYIELNPVRAGMVQAPGDYPWSSHHRNANGTDEPWITSHPTYVALGIDDASRQQAYRDLFRRGIQAETIDSLRAHTQQQKVWGSDRFQRQIEQLSQRAATMAPRGRPKKPGKCT